MTSLQNGQLLSESVCFIFFFTKKSNLFFIFQAQKLGFTEPDPRDDLSGLDVARKAVILARLIAGDDTSIELNQVSIEPLFIRFHFNFEFIYFFFFLVKKFCT
eukprot:GSMAST32.ASY1.ANO1.1460.1 assembled CDS